MLNRDNIRRRRGKDKIKIKSSHPRFTNYLPGSSQIGINLADPIFRGVYHGKERHPDDLRAVISRAQEVGCRKLIVTGSDLTSSRHALDIAKEYRERICSFFLIIFLFIFL